MNTEEAISVKSSNLDGQTESGILICFKNVLEYILCLMLHQKNKV